MVNQQSVVVWSLHGPLYHANWLKWKVCKVKINSPLYIDEIFIRSTKIHFHLITPIIHISYYITHSISKKMFSIFLGKKISTETNGVQMKLFNDRTILEKKCKFYFTTIRSSYNFPYIMNKLPFCGAKFSIIVLEESVTIQPGTRFLP